MSRARRVVGLVAVIFTIAGCSTPKWTQPQVLPTQAGPSAEPTPSSSPSPEPTPSAVCRGSIAGGADPARAGLGAWLCDDATGMAAQLSPTAVTQIKAVPKSINLQWTFMRCDGTAGSQYCIYRNVFGSDLIFRVPGQPGQKISEVKFDRTIYHANAEQYARHFLQAWVNGNEARMKALSNPEIFAYADSHPVPAAGYTVTLSPSEVWIFEVESSGADYRITLQGALGKANAITDLDTL